MTRNGRLRGADLTGALRAVENSADTPEEVRYLLREVQRYLLELESEKRELLEAHQALEESRDREVRELQLRLGLSERLARVGSRTVGIAHEINNPLAFLMGNLTLAMRILREQAHRPEAPRSPHPSASPEVALQALADAQVGAERIQKLVSDLGASARPMGDSMFSSRRPAVVPPRGTAPPLPSAVSAEHTEGARRGRILIVDDELRLGQTLQLLLGRAHDVHYTPSAREALDWIQAGQRYDAILCDLMMADVTGKQFYDALCQHSPEHVRRVIFMTGGAYTPASVDFVARMSNPILNKPFRPEELEKLLVPLVPSV